MQVKRRFGVQRPDEPLCTRLVNKEKVFYFLVGCLGRLLEVKMTAVCVPQVHTAAGKHIRPGTFSRSVKKGGGQ